MNKKLLFQKKKRENKKIIANKLIISLFFLVLIEFEFELKTATTAAETTATTERIETVLKRVKTMIFLLFGIKWIFAIVKFGSFFFKNNLNETIEKRFYFFVDKKNPI